MKKSCVIFVTLALCCCTVSLAQDEIGVMSEIEAVPAPVCDLANHAEESLVEAGHGFERITTPQPTPASTPPPCPTNTTCVGGTSSCSTNPLNCEAVGRIRDTDTGWTSCQLPSGVIGYCITGQTIHVWTQSCGQCSCCTGSGTICICPNDCGQVKTWGCVW